MSFLVREVDGAYSAGTEGVKRVGTGTSRGTPGAHEELARWINKIRGVIPNVGVLVEGLRIADGAAAGVERAEAAEAAHVVASHGVVVAGFGVTLVGSEKEFVAGGVVPGFAKRVVAELGESVAAGIGDKAIGEMVLVVILGAEESILARSALPE